MDRLIAIVLTAAAAATVQACTNGAAEMIDAAAEAPQQSADAQAAPPCPAQTTPVQIAPGEAHCRLNASLVGEAHLPAGRLYQIDGRVVVAASAASPETLLSIEPGVTLYATGPAARLVVERGAKLIAAGEPGSPIVFTSAYDLGYAEALALPPRVNPAAARGEWGGLVINGSAPVNGVDGVDGARCVEAASGVVCERADASGVGVYGGAGDPNGSGALAHAQIRFAGALDQSNGGVRRTAALTLQGVGAATRIEHLTIVNAHGDGMRLLGGDVGARDVAVVGAGDDGVEWSFGYRGALTSVSVAHDARLGDGDAGFEGSDGLPSVAGGLASTRSSRPTLIDVAAIGDPAVSDVGLRIKGGGVSIRGARLAGGFASAGFDIDGASTLRGLQPKDLSNIEIAQGDFPALSADADDAALAALFWKGAGNRVAALDLKLADALARPTVGAPQSQAVDPAGAPSADLQAADDTPEPALVAEAAIADIVEPAIAAQNVAPIATLSTVEFTQLPSITQTVRLAAFERI